MAKTSYTVLFFFIVCTLQSQVIPGLIAKYSFNNGNANDDLGKHNARVSAAKLTEDRFGNKNSAYYLQGNPDSYINLGTGNDMKPIRGTISIWVKVIQPMYKGQGVPSNPIIMTKAREFDDFNEAFCIGYHTDLKNIHVNTSGSELKQVTLCPTKETSLMEWHHVAITYDNNFLCFYLDGILEDKTAKNFETFFLGGDSIMVGGRTGKHNKRYLNACVDDIEIYNKVLTPAEIAALYNAPDPNNSSLILKWLVLFSAVVAFIVIILLFIKWRIKKALAVEKEKNEMRNYWYEQENRVLSAQMDPHFIFNSLNTIQQFIQINENEKAQNYLSKFSKLLRMLIASNVRDAITLKDEIKIFEKYLEIESIRFNSSFSYAIITGSIDPAVIKIPHFLIQPLIENAIWHGLLPKDGDKKLTVTFEIINKHTLCCTIDDNGVGRRNNSTSNGFEAKKSFAINFIQQRLQVFSKMKKTEYTIKLIDKLNGNNDSEGTTVIITIPILDN